MEQEEYSHTDDDNNAAAAATDGYEKGNNIGGGDEDDEDLEEVGESAVDAGEASREHQQAHHHGKENINHLYHNPGTSSEY